MERPAIYKCHKCEFESEKYDEVVVHRAAIHRLIKVINPDVEIDGKRYFPHPLFVYVHDDGEEE